MKHALGKLIILCVLVSCLSCSFATGEMPTYVDVDAYPEKGNILLYIPPLDEAINSIDVPAGKTVLGYSAYLDLRDCSWNVRLDYFDTNIQECTYMWYDITSQGGPLHVRTIGTEEHYGTIADYSYIRNTDKIFDTHVRSWEYVYGPHFLWTYQQKAEFYSDYGRTPSNEQGSWTLPDEQDLNYEDAMRLAQLEFYRQSGYQLAHFPVYEDTQFLVDNYGRRWWQFRYWMILEIDNNLYWANLGTITVEDSEAYWNGTGWDYIPRILELLLYSTQSVHEGTNEGV